MYIAPGLIPLFALLCWWRARGDTARVAASDQLLLLLAELKFALERRAGHLAMDEVAESASLAAFTRVEAAARLTEIGDWGKLDVERATAVPAGCEIVGGLLGAIFVLEAGVNVTDQVLVSVSNVQEWREGEDLRSLLLSHTTTSSTSPNLHISQRMSS